MSNKVNDTQVGFVQGTTVLMADGRVKPIEKIVPGDWVMSFDQTDAASELEPMEVIDTISYLSRDVIEVRSGDDAVMVARGQLFLTPTADWHRATETALITDRQGAIRSFTVQKVTEGKHNMYDIMVNQHHSLVANGFRVHNAVSTSGRDPDKETRGAGSTRGGDKNPGANSNKPDKTKPDSKPGPTSNPNTRERESVNNPNNGGRGKGGDGPGSPRQDNGQNQVNRKSAKKSKGKDRPKPPPPPAPEALAYAALQSLQEIMDYICDIMINYTTTNYFTIRTAAMEYMNYADGLSNDSFIHANSSRKISNADKNNLRSYNDEIIQLSVYIRTAFDPVKEPPGGPVALVTRGCLQVKGLVDRSRSVLAKYVGTGRSTINYTLPGMPKPPPVSLPIRPDAAVYVQTAPNQYVPAGNTVPPLTGGLGADYYRYRVVRGYLYGYKKGVGWVKIGPADQWEGQY